jgi:hypothetical protein
LSCAGGYLSSAARRRQVSRRALSEHGGRKSVPLALVVGVEKKTAQPLGHAV